MNNYPLIQFIMINGIKPTIIPKLKLFSGNKYIKLLLSLIIVLISTMASYAQSPDKINYQAIARNTSTGVELSHQDVYVVVKILAGDFNGEIVYQEDHQNIQTNMYGLFSLQIGNGIPISGDFSDLNWGDNSYWLEVDLDAGQGLKTIGTMEFVAVPYALHARTATFIDDADADPTNELVEDFTFDPDTRELTIVQAGDNKTVGIGSVDDADADPYNEIIENWSFENGILTFQEAGNNYLLDLNTLNIDDADADPTNELVEDFTFDSDTRELTIVQAGDDKTVGIGSVDDADADPYNEIIENWSFENGILTFQEAGNNYSLDLNTLDIDDADADPTNELVEDFIFDPDTRELTIVQAGDNKTVGIGSVDDADSDPDNERIDEGYPQLNGKQLDISEGGILYSVDLSPLNIWEESGDAIYTLSKDVGIGTDTPTAQLTVKQTPSGLPQILRVENNQSVAALSVGDMKVGLAGEVGGNHVQLHGSVGFTTKILDAGTNYMVQSDDYYIACRLLTNNNIQISMPDPTTCPGRVLYIKRVNKTGFSNPKVIINYNGHLLNFSSGNTTLQEVVLGIPINFIGLISLGNEGWATLQ